MSGQQDRRKNSGLSEDQFQRLKAELRDELKPEIKNDILNDIFAEIGRSTVSKLLWALGILSSAVLAYLGFTGKITLK